MVPVPPQLLVQRLQQKRCVLFAGAGLSAAANFPSWPQLLSELIDEVRAEKSVTEELRKLLDRNQLLDVADACQRMIGAKGFRRFMVRRFGGHHAVPEVHQKITELPLAGIVTTNYDKLFELAYRGELKVRTHADPQLTELPYDGPPIGPRPFLLKAHGDVDRPENLVLTAEDYARQIHSNPQIKVAFNWIMFSHAILFVGYSLKDPDFTAWLQWYSRIFRPHSGRYALMSDVGPVEAEQIRSAIGVEVLPYPKDRHELVAEFIDALVKLGQPLAANLGEKATESDARESVDKKAAKEFIARLDSIPYQRAALLARPTPYEQSALFKKYGSGWVEMRKASLTEIALSKRHRGKVIVIPDVFESSLATYGSQKGKEIWLNPFRIATGGLTNLRMRPDGSSEQEVRAVGILKRWYADLLISLSADKWDVRAFWYDWRQDFNKTAAELNSRIEEWFGDEPVCHIIAHRAGGMVARTFIKSYPDRWNAMLDRQSELPALRGGRLVMLGASQRGSLLIPQLITGGSLFVRKLSMVDLFHSETAIQAMLNSWPSLYQQLPSPFALPAFKLFYDSKTYGHIDIPQRHLDEALRLHESLEPIVDPERMSCVFNDEPTTPLTRQGIRSGLSGKLDAALAAQPHAANLLAELKAPDGTIIPSYYVGAEGHLPSNRKVTAALNELLETGVTFSLRDSTDEDRAVRREPSV